PSSLSLTMRSLTHEEIIVTSLVGAISLIQFCFVVYTYRTWNDKRMLCFGLLSIISGVLAIVSGNVEATVADGLVCVSFDIISTVSYFVNGWAPRILYGIMIESLMYSFVKRPISHLMLKSYLMAFIFIPFSSASTIYDMFSSNTSISVLTA